MFGRRRASSNPPVKSSPNSAATLAASQAFLKGRESNASLSSAAAAAALRTHATTPTPVGDIQTKRMVRRGSTSSAGSGSSQHRPGLRRQSSSGSMTERTFRGASPSRSSPSVEADPNAPPVPAMPKDVPAPAGHRRATSLEPPFRGGSPAGRGGGRGVSLERGTGAPQGRGQGQGHAARKTDLPQLTEVERENSIRVMNFSRPISPQAASPATKTASPRAGHSGWFAAPVVNDQPFRDDTPPRPKTSTGVSSMDARNVRQSVQNAVNKPVSSNKGKLSSGVEGARLSSGSMRKKPSGTAINATPIDPKSSSSVYDPSTRTFIPKQEAMARHRELHDDEPVERRPAQRAPERTSSPLAQPPPQRVRSPPIQATSERPQSPIQHALQRPFSPPMHHSPELPQRSVQRKQEVQPVPSHQDSQEPHHQTRAGALLMRQSSEDYGATDQHEPAESTPSANESRKLASSPAPLPTDELNDPSSPSSAPTQDGPYPRLTIPLTPTPDNSLFGRGRGSVAGDRQQSLSPGRTAHFANVAVELPNNVRHQPLGRSASPAKSALKHSPSSSVRNSSPAAVAASGVGRGAPSEASDTVSEDGSRSTPRKKRNVRVSFDEDAVIAGTSAYGEVQSPTSPSGIGASRWSQRRTSEQDIDDVLTPRPVLPSFGSIRGRSRREDNEEVPEKVTETVSSSLSTSVGSITDPVDASSDHALGSIISQDVASKASTPAHMEPTKRDTLEPLPPEVTSVEGSGYVSDSDQSDYAEQMTPVRELKHESKDGKSSAPLAEAEPKTLTESVEMPKSHEIAVPEIAILPATPGVEEKPERSFETFDMPGSWDQYDEPEADTKKEEPVPAEEPQLPNSVKEQDQLSVVQEQTDESDDHSSIYSDAEEYPSDNEFGFSSIDAVVRSPIVSPPPGLASASPPESPIAKSPSATEVPTDRATQPTEPLPSPPVEDWNVVQSHWNGLSETRRQQLEQDARSLPVKTSSEATSAPKPKAAKPKAKKAAAAAPRKSEPLEVRQSPKPATQPLKSALKKPVRQVEDPPEPEPRPMKKSMRSPQEIITPEPRMRKTMRGGEEPRQAPSSPTATQMRKSMRGPDSMRSSMRPESGLAASRHSMPPPQSQPARAALQKRNPPPATRPQSMSTPLMSNPKPAKSTPIGFTNDDDSDGSVSSFKRERPRTSGGDGGRYTMRASMRGASGPAPTMRAAPVARPMSPPMAASPPATNFRKSMRPTSPTPASESGLKSSRFSIRSLSPGGRLMGRSARTGSIDATAVPDMPSPKRIGAKAPVKSPAFGKSPKPKPPIPAKSAARFKSRFADSSDEDEDERPSRFQSRFADSDEEDSFELPSGLTPVRGIPRKPGEEDRESTDLSDEDSSEETPAATSSKDIEKGATPAMTNGNKAQTPALAAGSLRQSKHAEPTFQSVKKEKSKRGFFGLGKKKPQLSSLDTQTQQPKPVTEESSIPMPPQPRNRALTPIGEDKTIDPPTPSSTTLTPTPRSPKLQRRSMPGRSTSDTWPLHQPPKIGMEERPSSSDGIVQRSASARPRMRARFASGTSVAEDDEEGVQNKAGKEVVFGRSGKKKRFQGLRRAFGLND